MKKQKIIWTLLLVIISNLAIAQNETPIDKKRLTEIGKEAFKKSSEQNPTCNAKDGNWWEPDTVISRRSTTTIRYIYSYDENGMETRRREDLKVSDTWIPQYEYQYTYDANRNLLSQTDLKRDTDENMLVNYRRFLYRYNARNQITYKALEYWENGEWTAEVEMSVPNNPYRRIYTYNERHDLVSELYQYLEDSEWKNAQLDDYVYDYEANSLVMTILKWHLYSACWDNYDRFLYTFDERGNLLSEHNQYWRYGQWMNVDYVNMGLYSTLHEYTYDENDNLLTHIEKIWENGNCINWNMYENEYDNSDNLVIQNWYGWMDNSWLKSIFYIYTYNESNRMLTCTSSSITNEVTKPTFLTVKEYDDRNNCTSTLKYSWKNDQWENLYFYRDVFNENGNCITGFIRRWTNDEWEYWDYSNLVFKYNNSQSTSDILYSCRDFEVSYTKVNKPVHIDEQPFEEVVLYPNPTQDKFFISVQNTEIKSIELYNLTGHKLGEYNQSEIDISSLPAGIYLVKIYTERGTLSKKMVKQ